MMRMEGRRGTGQDRTGQERSGGQLGLGGAEAELDVI